MISDKVLEKIEQKHHVELEDALDGIRNAKEWRKMKDRYEAESITSTGRRIFVVVDRFTDEWQIVTAWWL